MITQIKDHLQTFPGFAGWTFRVYALGSGIGCGGLFCRGERELSRRQDILGKVRLRRRLTLTLALNLPRTAGDDAPEMARRLLEFARWLRAEPGPVLGEDQTVQVRGGKLRSANADGMAVYDAEIIYEFTSEVT